MFTFRRGGFLFLFVTSPGQKNQLQTIMNNI